MKCNGVPTINRDRYILDGVRDITFAECDNEPQKSDGELYFCVSCHKEYENLLGFCLEVLRIKRLMLEEMLEEKENA